MCIINLLVKNQFRLNSNLIFLSILLLVSLLSLFEMSRITICKGKTNCEAISLISSGYIDSLKKLASNQRHDFMNFFQIIYGYLQLHKEDMAIEHIKKVTSINSSMSKAFRISIPSISFVLMKMINEADNLGILITFNVEKYIDSNLRQIDNEDKIVFELEKVIKELLDYLRANGEMSLLTIKIQEYKDRIEFILCGEEFKNLANKIKGIYRNVLFNDLELCIFFEYDNEKTLDSEDNIYSKLLYS